MKKILLTLGLVALIVSGFAFNSGKQEAEHGVTSLYGTTNSSITL